MAILLSTWGRSWRPAALAGALGLAQLAGLTCFSGTATAFGDDDYQVPDEVRAKYQYLYNESVRDIEGGKAFHKGRLYHRGGLNILSLAGDRFEMAFQHGRLLKDQILAGVVPAASEMLHHTIRNAYGNTLRARAAEIYLRLTVLKPTIRHSLEEAPLPQDVLLQTVWGLSESTGMSTEMILEAAFNPEVLQILLGTHTDTFPGGEGHCSAFAAWGDATVDGRMLVGRNTDYGLNGFYDSHPTVIYYKPDEGQRYMSITSAGVHNAGVFGVNESGLYLASHTIPTATVSTDGYPIFMVAESVLRRAHTFDEAVALFREFTPASGWSYMLVSTREGKVGTIELANGLMGVRMATGDTHVQTNHYLTPELKPYYLNVNQSIDDDTLGRFQRITDVLAARHGSLDVRAFTRLLGDKTNVGTGVEQTMPNTVAVHTTMSSAVLDAANDKIYVANGQAPVSQNTYVELPAVWAFDADRFAAGTYATIVNDDFPTRHPGLAAGEKHYVEAKKAFEYANDYPLAMAELDRALALDPANKMYAFNLGIIALKDADRARARQAFERITAGDATKDSHWTHLAHYYLGMIAAHEERWPAALAELTAVRQATGVNAKLKAAVDKLFGQVEAEDNYKIDRFRLGLLFQQADLVNY
jgi:predicted choloylglycine hydrolase